MRCEIRNLFGTRKIILNKKETEQYAKERIREEKEFFKFLQNEMPRMFWNMLLASTILVIIICVYNIIS